MNDILSVKEFISKIGYSKEGTCVALYVEATVCNRIVYSEPTDCYISYDYGYSQYKISIDWNISNEVMSNLKLHSSYNTNFQNMKVVSNSLIITDTEYIISLRKQDT